MDDLLTTSNDLNFGNGDLVLGDSNDQTIEHLLLCGPGDLLEFPTLGVQIRTLVNGTVSKLKIKQRIRQSLKADDYQIDYIDVERTGEITLKALRP